MPSVILNNTLARVRTRWGFTGLNWPHGRILFSDNNAFNIWTIGGPVVRFSAYKYFVTPLHIYDSRSQTYTEIPLGSSPLNPEYFSVKVTFLPNGITPNLCKYYSFNNDGSCNTPMSLDGRRRFFLSMATDYNGNIFVLKSINIYTNNPNFSTSPPQTSYQVNNYTVSNVDSQGFYNLLYAINVSGVESNPPNYWFIPPTRVFPNIPISGPMAVFPTLNLILIWPRIRGTYYGNVLPANTDNVSSFARHSSVIQETSLSGNFWYFKYSIEPCHNNQIVNKVYALNYNDFSTSQYSFIAPPGNDLVFGFYTPEQALDILLGRDELPNYYWTTTNLDVLNENHLLVTQIKLPVSVGVYDPRISTRRFVVYVNHQDKTISVSRAFPMRSENVSLPYSDQMRKVALAAYMSGEWFTDWRRNLYTYLYVSPTLREVFYPKIWHFFRPEDISHTSNQDLFEPPSSGYNGSFYALIENYGIQSFDVTNFYRPQVVGFVYEKDPFTSFEFSVINY